MYKLLLCWRYLRTRYIALVCIVSVMLGVATLIVVNSVMDGFSAEIQSRMNDMMGDVLVESRSMDGVPDAELHMRKIQEIAGDSIVGMTPTVELPALMYINTGNGKFYTQQIMMLGVDEATFSNVSNSSGYLQHPSNREQLSFQLREGGYDVYDRHITDPEKMKLRPDMQKAGWAYRREQAMLQKQQKELMKSLARQQPAEDTDPFAAAAAASGEQQGRDFDPTVEQHVGIVLGIQTCTWRDGQGVDHFHARPGSDIRISFPKASLPPKAINEIYTVVDFIESKWPDFDANFAVVPLHSLQQSRGMIDPTTGIARFTSLRIKIRPNTSPEAIRDLLREHFPAQYYVVSTWRDKQGALLAAIQMETLVLNILLFMIIAVAGFGILAVFCMIVVEKTRDIGILKSLGASSRGVMGIFLVYGLALGMVGAGVGTAMGLTIVHYINQIKDLISDLTGQPVFDPSIYFLSEIPTIVRTSTLTWICVGAISIAILASIFPAWRASRLHPVKALRYE